MSKQRVSSATTDLQITPNTTPHTVLWMLNTLTQDFLCKLVSSCVQASTLLGFSCQSGIIQGQQLAF